MLQQPQYRGKALPSDNSDVKLVKQIAERIISAVEEGHGAGFQKHVEKFDWEVSSRCCVRQPIPFLTAACKEFLKSTGVKCHHTVYFTQYISLPAMGAQHP